MNKYIISFILCVLFTSSLLGQEIKKDTLVFKLDEKYIMKGKINTTEYYLKELVNEGDLSFKIIRLHEDITLKKEICFKKYIRSTDSYDKSERILNGYKLWTKLEAHTIFFVITNNGKRKYIEVQPHYEIE